MFANPQHNILLAQEKMLGSMRPVNRALWFALLAFVVLLAGVARSHRLREVFFESQIYFLDPDCYARMSRVKHLEETGAWFLRHHSFENWPEGTTPHTTAPLDWCILGLKAALDLGLRRDAPEDATMLAMQTRDLAGALVSPLLAMLACSALALCWPRHEGRRAWSVLGAAALFAVSPALVHAMALGRPDHQSLLIALLAVALVSEVRLLRAECRAWAVAAGVCWALALWVSLYEPALLLAAALLAWTSIDPAQWRKRHRWLQLGCTAACFSGAMLLDGWRAQLPAPELQAAFARWQQTIGEMRPLDLRGGIIFSWLGFTCLAAPILLARRWRESGEARLFSVLLAATFALTLWQVRWGYFLALVYVLSLPVQLAALPGPRWLPWSVFLAGLWPVAGDWDRQLFRDDPAHERAVLVQRIERKALRELAAVQKARDAGPFLAPWWLSPAVAYWSGQPGVAGSSHQSLPGILDAAEIALAPDAGTALAKIEARGVKWILADDPGRVKPEAAMLLGVESPEVCFADQLVGAALPEPWTLRIVPDRDLPRLPREFFKVWRVR